jgi:hypothetical protein
MKPRIGDRIRLDAMADDPAPVPAGSTGRVVDVFDRGSWVQVIVHWDNGRSVALAVPPDRITVIGSVA